MKHILDHFQKNDPILFRLTKKLALRKLEKSTDYFTSLTREIIGQQLSGKAADAIFAKVLALFPEKKITPDQVLALSDEALRSAGPSWAKVRFLKDLATKVCEKEIDLAKLDRLPDGEVIQYLTKVKGVGPWTAEMFLMFSLAREDVFSHGDLGLNKAIRRLYGLKRPPSRKRLEALTNKWSPYRTYGCLLLWDSLELSDDELPGT